jgi:GcrA cell cycle regulator
MPRHPGDWSEEEQERLKELWTTTELSATRIGLILSKSKNAIIGRAHKLGLPARRVGIKVSPLTGLEKRKAMELLTTTNATELEFGGLEPLTNYLEVPDSGCRWPGEAELSCCGRPKARGSYCEAHAKRAYTRSQNVSEHGREVHAQNFRLHVAKYTKLRLNFREPSSPEDLGL